MRRKMAEIMTSRSIEIPGLRCPQNISFEMIFFEIQQDGVFGMMILLLKTNLKLRVYLQDWMGVATSKLPALEKNLSIGKGTKKNAFSNFSREKLASSNVSSGRSKRHFYPLLHGIFASHASIRRASKCRFHQILRRL